MLPDLSEHPELWGYQYRERLGTGTTAVVHRYHQLDPDRDVAVKVMRSQLDRSTTFTFLDEARYLAKLSDHPNILSVYDIGVCDNGLGYLVLEYASGGSLQELLRKHTLGCEAMLDLGIRLASALCTAHRAGIVHRDIKPSNILITHRGIPVLADFGIASSVYRTRRSTGFSIPWSAPEILSGYNGGNEQSDIYSLGSFLIACLCGCSPFEYVYHLRQEAELSNLIITGDLPRLDIVGLPDAVEGLLHQAISKNPDERFGSALLFARALQQAQLQCFGHTTALSVLGEEPLPAAYRKHRIARKSIARDIETRNRHGIPSRNRWWSVIVTAVVMTAISVLFAMYVIPRMDTERSSDTTIITIPGNLSGTTNEDGGIIAPQSAEMAELQGLIIRTT